MQKDLWKKGLVVVIIFLFVGASVISTIARDVSNGEWSETEVVSTESTSDSQLPSLAIDTSGVVHVAWDDDTNYDGSGTDRDVFYKMKPNGGSWTMTEVVSTESTGDSNLGYERCLAVDALGAIYVLWQDTSNYDGCGADIDIFYKMKPNGGSWTMTEVVSTESTNDSHHGPSLAVEPGGTVHVVWADDTNYDGSGTDMDILYKYKPSDGSWTTTEVVSTESTNDSYWPSLAVESDGTVHVAWHDGAGSGSDVFYKYKVSGGNWTTTEVVSTESNASSGYPSLDVDSSGNIHVAWYDNTDYDGSGSNYDIFYKMKTSGSSWTTTEVVSTESSGNSHHHPSLAVDASGTVHVSWDDWTDYNGSGTDMDIFYKKKLGDGSWSTTKVVSTESTSNSWHPSLAVDSSGTVHVAWDDDTNYGGSGSDRDIFYKYKSGLEITNITMIASDPLDTDIGWENFTCTVTDSDGVNEVKLILTGDITTEYPMTKNGDNYSCNITISTAGEYTYHIWANDTSDNYAESASDTFALPLNADVDEDGSVGFVDIMMVAGMWNALGPNGWDRADVDNNGEVGFVDVMMVAGQWGQEW